MAHNEAQRCLICYDIADPKRLVRVHRFLRDNGLPVQYSVFTAKLTASMLRDVMDGLCGLIDARRDDVRIYPLPRRLDCVVLGVQILPDEALLLHGSLPMWPAPGRRAGMSGADAR